MAPRRIIALLAVALLAAACGSDPASEGVAPTADDDGGCPDDLAGPLSSWERVGFRGAVLLVEGGEVVCELGVGTADDEGTPITVDTVFSIGSVTKSITAATVLSMVDDGLVALETPVAEVLPELAGREATVEDVLRHEGGFGSTHAADTATVTLDEALALIAEEEPLFAPGEDVSYSNTGYTVLAAIIERVAGQPFRDAVRERMLTDADGAPIGGWWHGEPAAAGPRAVGYLDGREVGTGDPTAGPRWGLEGAGGIAMTVRELAGWASALDDGELLSPGSVELATTAPGGEGETVGWVAAGPPLVPEAGLFSAGGGGTGHNVVIGWWPDADRTLVMASNDDAMRAEALFERTVGALVSGDAVPEAPERGEVDADVLADLVGEYVVEDGSLAVLDDDGAAAEVSGALLPAVLPLPDELVAAAAEHEALVLEQIEVSDERENLEEAIGELDDVRVIATVFVENELRTHVAITSTDGTELVAWFALEPNGELAAAEVPAPPIRLLLSARADGSLAVVATDGAPNGVALRPDGDGLVVVGPDGTELRLAR
ncbi:MAG: serine hydrolase domain-containing protein [Actinomycetota bacterium]